MKYQLPICATILIAVTAATGQIASHAPTAVATTAGSQPAATAQARLRKSATSR